MLKKYGGGGGGCWQLSKTYFHLKLGKTGVVVDSS